MDYHGLSYTILDYPRLLKIAFIQAIYMYILFTDRQTDWLMDIGTPFVAIPTEKFHLV